MASCSIEDFAAAPSFVLATSRPATSSCWSPPPHGVYKVNVEGVSSILDGSSSIGVIIRDWKGVTIAALCKPPTGPFFCRISGSLSIGTRRFAGPRDAANSRVVRM